MILNDSDVKTITSVKAGDVICIAEKTDYFNGKRCFTNVRDVVKENDKLVILI